MKDKYILYILFFVVFVTGCFPRMVIYEGTRMSSAKAINIIKQKAQKRIAADNYNAALQLYASIPSVDRRSPQAPYGLLQAGNIALNLKSYAKARYYYNELISAYPDSDYTADARIDAGIISLRGAKYTDAAAEFNALVPNVSGNKKGRVYFLLGESYYRTGMYKNAFNAISHSIKFLSADHGKELAQLFLKKIVNNFLTGEDIRQLSGRRYPIYESALLRLKLTKDMMSLHKYKEALALANTIILSGVASPDIMNAASSIKREILAITQVNFEHIGTILPLSGDFAPYGRQVLNGIELALNVFSAASSQYKLFIMDSKGIPELAAKQAEQLVKVDHIAAIVGPLLNSTSKSVAFKMQSYGVPMVTLSQNSGITNVGDYIFQNSLTSKDQARNIVGYAMKTLGIKRFAVLYPEDTYGEDMMRAFVKQVLKSGGTINALEGYSTAETDFKRQIKKLVGTYYLDLRKQDIKKLPPSQKSNPPPIIDFSAIFIPDYYEKVAMIAPQLLFYITPQLFHNDTKKVQLLGGNGWSGKDLIRMGGRYVNGAIYTDGFFTQSSSRSTKLFVNAYKNMFHREPTILSALGYDTANIIIRAMRGDINRQDIRESILAMKDYEGVTGIIRYNGDRVPVKKLYLLQVHGRKIREIPY